MSATGGRTATEPAIAVEPDLTTVPRWFGPAERPLLGWLTAAAAGPTTSAVVMLPPVGYQWWSAHRTLRSVAERLAGAGHAVLRFDYDGTGDSAGAPTDRGRVDAWRGSVAAAVAEMRGLGMERVTLFGTRPGGSLALLDAARLGVDAVVAWAPPTSGKRFGREVRMLADEVPGEDGSVALAGTIFTAATLAELAAIDLAAISAPPAPRIGLIGAGLRPLADRLEEVGAEVTVLDPPGAADSLEVPAEYAVVAPALVEAAAELVGPADPGRVAVGPGPTQAELAWGDGRVVERVVGLGEAGLIGILTTPVEGPGRSVTVWLNSGSEPHVGSGRAWVEYARGLALRGEASLRLDFSGWGESPDRGHAPGRPYDRHGIAETLAVVAALEALGYERVVLAGLCAGAWIALRAVLERPVAGVFALNPQLYWRPGDPVEALMSETRARREAERAREEKGGRLGVWTALDLLGARPWAGRWLDSLVATGVPTTFCFAAGDDGLEYLENRLARRLDAARAEGGVRVVEIPDIDHSMHRVWLRERILAAVLDFVRSLP